MRASFAFARSMSFPFVMFVDGVSFQGCKLPAVRAIGGKLLGVRAIGGGGQRGTRRVAKNTEGGEDTGGRRVR